MKKIIIALTILCAALMLYAAIPAPTPDSPRSGSTISAPVNLTWGLPPGNSSYLRIHATGTPWNDSPGDLGKATSYVFNGAPGNYEWVVAAVDWSRANSSTNDWYSFSDIQSFTVSNTQSSGNTGIPGSSGAGGTPRVQGYFDYLDCARGYGWVWYPDMPGVAATVDVLVDGNRIESIQANQYRSDLSGYGGGYHAFNFDFPGNLSDGRQHQFELVADWNGSQQTFGASRTVSCGGSGVTNGAGKYALPVPNYWSQQVLKFGEAYAKYWCAAENKPMQHLAIDISNPAVSTEVRSASIGVVKYARKYGECSGCFVGDPNTEHGGFGWVVIVESQLDSGDPYGSKAQFIYAHLDPAVSVHEGQMVRPGDLIGHVGRYQCWVDHTHFGIYIGDFNLVTGSCGTQLPSWLHGYSCSRSFPGGYVDPNAFLKSHGVN